MLALLFLSPLLAAFYWKTVPYAPMKGQDGTWASDAWQHDIPSGFRTRLRDGELAFFAPAAAGEPCGPPIGSAPALGDDPSSKIQGTLGRLGVTLSRDGGLLAVSYDQYDPWFSLTRGPGPKRKVTVRFHQIAVEACAD